MTEVESLADGVTAQALTARRSKAQASSPPTDFGRACAPIAPDAALRFSGATAWRALLPRDQVPAPFDAPVVGLWLGPRTHLVHYPVRGGKDVNIVAVVEGGGAKQGWNLAPSPASCCLPSRWASPASACWKGRGLALLVALPAAAVAPLGEGRVALLGDAAHPVLPYLAQGAALAIEDAVALAAASRHCGGDPASAFPRYEALRMRRAARVQRRRRASAASIICAAPRRWRAMSC